MFRPIVSIIVPTKDEQKNLERLLESLKQQTFKDLEMIVVDNNSTDSTTQIAKRFTEKVYNHGPERSAQRNFGLRKALGKYVLFVDADMELTTKILTQCVGKMENDSKIVGLVIDETSRGSGYLAKVKNLEKKIYQGFSQIEAPRFFRRGDLLRVGGYTTNLIAGEDWDLATKIAKLGKFARIKAKILHFEGPSMLSDLGKKYYYAKHISKYAQKNPEAFQRQSSIWRFSILFKKPKIILENPLEFSGLLLLKSAQYLVYLIAKVSQK